MERGSSVRGALARRGERAGTPTGASDPAEGNGSHHAPLRPPTAKPGARAKYTPEISRGPDRGVTPVRVPEAYGAGRLGGQVGRR